MAILCPTLNQAPANHQLPAVIGPPLLNLKLFLIGQIPIKLNRPRASPLFFIVFIMFIISIIFIVSIVFIVFIV